MVGGWFEDGWEGCSGVHRGGRGRIRNRIYVGTAGACGPAGQGSRDPAAGCGRAARTCSAHGCGRTPNAACFATGCPSAGSGKTVSHAAAHPARAARSSGAGRNSSRRSHRRCRRLNRPRPKLRPTLDRRLPRQPRLYPSSPRPRRSNRRQIHRRFWLRPSRPRLNPAFPIP